MKLKHSLLIFISLLIFPSSGYAGDLTDAVVKVFVTRNSYDYYRPWQSRGVSTTTGSGSVISGNRILTNAHVAADQTFIQVRKNSDPRKYTARLEAIGHDCDLAILRVDDPEFFEGVDPIELGDLPTLQSTVVVLGYPQGGDKLSITEGVVSRVELTAYSQSARQLLAVQIDAAINPGNSGGPVIRDGKMVGVAMQVLNSGQNIGYMIPVPIIEHFFEDLGDKKFDGFPFLGIEYHTTENPTLRKYHKMEKNDGGVIVTRTLPYSPADNILQENDIILEIDGVPIAQDGTFKFRQNERLAMTHLVTQKQIGDNLSLTILRDGTKKKIKIGLTPFSTLVHPPNAFEKPPYYIHGGLVFTVLSTDLLKAWGGRWWEQAPGDFTYYLAGSGRLNKEKRKELVVLLTILADDINVGYGGTENSIIRSINGKPFKSFEEFVKILNQVKKNEDYTIIETETYSTIILENKQIDEITNQILERNNIPRQYSQDVENWL